MNRRFIVRSLLATTLLTLTAPGNARADTGPSVTGIVGTVTRLEPDGTSADDSNEHPHPAGVPANVIDLDDCLGNLEYGFDLGISNVNDGYNLNVWAGTDDCTILADRTLGSATCWPVASFIVATQTPFPIDVRMQDIVSQAFATQPASTYVPSTDAGVCAPKGGATSKSLSLHFFFADDAGNQVGTAQTYPVSLDLVTNPTPVDGGVGSDGGTGPRASGGGGCTVASVPADPSTGLTLTLGLGAIALVRRRQRATGTRRAQAS